MRAGPLGPGSAIDKHGQEGNSLFKHACCLTSSILNAAMVSCMCSRAGCHSCSTGPKTWLLFAGIPFPLLSSCWSPVPQLVGRAGAVLCDISNSLYSDALSVPSSLVAAAMGELIHLAYNYQWKKEVKLEIWALFLNWISAFCRTLGKVLPWSVAPASVMTLIQISSVVACFEK